MSYWEAKYLTAHTVLQRPLKPQAWSLLGGAKTYVEESYQLDVLGYRKAMRPL